MSWQETVYSSIKILHSLNLLQPSQPEKQRCSKINHTTRCVSINYFLIFIEFSSLHNILLQITDPSGRGCFDVKNNIQKTLHCWMQSGWKRGRWSKLPTTPFDTKFTLCQLLGNCRVSRNALRKYFEPFTEESDNRTITCTPPDLQAELLCELFGCYGYPSTLVSSQAHRDSVEERAETMNQLRILLALHSIVLFWLTPLHVVLFLHTQVL